jgi:cobalt-zinc-cadmium efflux system outer membrane protein
MNIRVKSLMLKFYTAALESREQVTAQAYGEIIQAKSNLKASMDKLSRFDSDILREAKTAANSAEFAYSHGAMGVLDLLDSRRTLKMLEIDAATVRADYAKSLAAWDAALTGDYAK